MIRLLLISLLLFRWTFAQSAEDLFGSWASEQQQRARSIRQVSFSETREITLRVNETFRRNLSLNYEGHWANGQFRVEMLSNPPFHRNAPEDPGLVNTLQRSTNLIPPFLWQMRVIGNVSEERYRQTNCWKIALLPGQSSMFQYIDLWIAKSDKRLVAAKGYIRPQILRDRPNRHEPREQPSYRGGTTPFRPPSRNERGGLPRMEILMGMVQPQQAEERSVTAEFIRHANGLDIPVKITLEALFPRQRRERIFHIAVRQESRFSDFRFGN